MTEKARADLETLSELVRDNKACLTIHETPEGKSVGITTADTPDYSLDPDVREMFLDMIETYEDLIIELHEIHRNNDGVEELWRIGRAVNKHAEQRGLDEPVFEEIAVFIPFVDVSEQWLRYASFLDDLYDSPEELPDDASNTEIEQPTDDEIELENIPTPNGQPRLN